jgi:Ca-activated chloride channel family protein
MTTRTRFSFIPPAAWRAAFLLLLYLVYLVFLMFVPGPAAGDQPARLANPPPAAAPSPPLVPRQPSESAAGLLFSVEGGTRLLFAPSVATEAKITVNGVVARARVSQTFLNPSDQWVEGIYVFPLPENAAVDHMTMRIGDRVIEGRIEEREEARRIYEAAREQGRRAGLIDQERPNIFTASVANIGPGDEIVVAIDYQQPLRYDQGAFRLRFPMVVGPRFIPGQVEVVGFGGGFVNTGEVPDADRISPPVLHPDLGKINPVRLAIDLNPGFELAVIESSYHPIAVADVSDVRYRVTLKAGPVPADRDFELIWRPALGAAPKAALFTETAQGADHSLVMVVPPASDPSDDRTRSFPREIVFVIDTSGSMAGKSIAQAREALLFALDRLAAGDRFNIIGFNQSAYALFSDARDVTEGIRDMARHFVRRLEAEGGTVMAPALGLALKGAAPPGYVRQVVFLTDGAVGNEAQLFRLVHQRLGATRLFPIGIGSAPNSYFMTKAAEVGRGTYTYIGKLSEVRERMERLFENLESPVLTDLHVSWPRQGPIETGMAAEPSGGPEMYPRVLPDLYAGEPVVFTARRAGLAGPITVSGRLAGEPWQATVVSGDGGTAEGVAKLWARDKIDAVLDGLHEGADPAAVRRQVVALGLAHQLVTRYTSLVAVDVTPARPSDEPLTSRHMPTNLPDGWEYDKVFGPAGERAKPLQRDAAGPLPATPVAAKFAQVQISPRAGLGMPQGATSAPLQLRLAAAFLLLGLFALWLRRRLA